VGNTSKGLFMDLTGEELGGLLFKDSNSHWLKFKFQL